jgi:hypothetical protein
MRTPTPLAALLRALVGALLGVLLLTACTAAPGTPSSQPGGQKLAPSLVALFQQTLERHKARLSAFEREVLERAIKTGSIPAADYEDAFSRRTACMTQAGYRDQVKKMPNGIYQITPTPPAGTDGKTWIEKWADSDRKCASGNLIIIEGLYRTQQGNKELLSDPLEIAVRCLVKEGLAPATFTAKDLENWLTKHDPPLPFSPADPKAQTCFSNAGIGVGAA